MQVQTRSGTVSKAASRVQENSIGAGGNIAIETSVLEVLDGAQLQSRTAGTGDAGNVIINANKRVTFARRSENGQFPSAAVSNVSNDGVGNGGSINITTSVLQILEGARFLAETRGTGNAGDVIINASDHVTFAGIGPNGQVSAALSSVSGNGSGGDVYVVTLAVELLDGAFLFAGIGGDGEGDAGNVIIDARDRATFSGVAEDGLPGGAISSVFANNSSAGGSVNVTTGVLEVREGARLAADTRGQGSAGDVNVRATDRVLLNNGDLRATSEGTGRGGSITTNTPFLLLTNQSEIATRTRSADGGNITLNVDNVLALTDSSTITTEAGTAEAGGDGGDITINTQFIATRLSENSDIVADAFDGDGGNVNITATGGVFGIVPRPERTPLSDITASSRNGVSGTVAIESPDVNPNQSATELPTALDAPDVVQSCREAFVQTGSEFVVTGRGGLPPGPLDSAAAILWQDALPIEGNVQTAPEIEGEPVTDSNRATPPPIVEIRGWIKNEQGQIELVAENPQQVAVGQPVVCQG